MVLTAIIAHGWSWWYLCAFAMIYLVTTLPFTLIGDSVPDFSINYYWVVLWSFFLGFSGFPFVIVCGGWKIFLLAHILTVAVVSSVCLASNNKTFAYFFPWKFCEAIAWAMAMYPSLLILQ
jgi:hypothetical protein